MELAISESQKLCQTKNGQAGTSKQLVDLTAAAKTLQNPWGGGINPTNPSDLDINYFYRSRSSSKKGSVSC